MLMHKLLGKPVKAGAMGIEVEVEAGTVLPADVPAPWVAKPDHSLRGRLYNNETRTDASSMEYVTNGCIEVEGKLRVIERLTSRLARYEVDADSPRTSVHVHINILKLTPIQLWTSIFSYWIAENVFMEYCGEERKGNMFCLRLKDAEGVLCIIERALKSKQPFYELGIDTVRYCGLNLKSTYELGSLEFRGMRGTIDAGLIDTWSTMVYDVVHKSYAKWDNPEKALDYFWEQGPNNFLSAITSWSNFTELTSKNKEWQDSMTENASILSDIIYSTDWEKWNKKVTKEVDKINSPLDPVADWRDLGALGVPRTATERLAARARRYAQAQPAPEVANTLTDFELAAISTYETFQGER